ncbi:LuxR C-terminal-related transcriptional regulator [Cohnella algarum]|uniref:LuxR C-terminal-related transcriptional regulator n=1 Tax=Cohnella algarum TaxID=2044859 RepID=UPI0019671943|nr:LuxR C-terminal-related transcriptional regulator [Cohnella algarum]MBN2980360.1 hypothetical protein [Cohnella algarum]
MEQPDSEPRFLTESLLHSKLEIPRPAPSLIERNRLTQKLGEALNGALTLVCAPAGFGKTTLACQWIRECGIDAAWVSLDEGDNEGSRMWRYIAAAIDRLRPGFMDDVKPVLSPLHTGNFEQGLIYFLNVLNRLSGPLLIVLDDFHLIREDRLNRGVAYLAEHLPAHLHLCLLSRTEPGFAAARMEARQTALRLSADDLRFDAREGESFFREARVALGKEGTAELVKRTEGWVTGLKLALLSMRSLEDSASFVREFAGDSRRVRQYLMEEVYEGLSGRMRSFLRKISVLKRWNASLCRGVTGFEDAGSLVGELERAQLFVVPLDSKGSWFRFHHLFSEFLRGRLELEGEERAASLYEAAGRWCEERNLQEEAVEYYLLGGDYKRAVFVLEKMASRIIDWEWSNLRKWLSSIPTPFLLTHPALFFSYVNSLVAEDANDILLAEQLMGEAESWFAAASEDMSEEERNRFLAMSHYVRGTIMVFGRHDLAEARKHYELVARYAPDGIKIIFGQPDAPLQAATARAYKMGSGQVARAIAEPYTLQLAELYRAVNPVFLGRLFVNHAEMLYIWNDLEAAERYAAEGVKWAERNPNRSEYELVPGWICLARIKGAQGRLFEAVEILESGKWRMGAMEFERGVEQLDMELCRLRLLKGDAAAALEWGERSGLGVSDPVSVYLLYDYELFSRVLLEKGRGEEAFVLLKKLLHAAQREKRLLDAVEIMALQARYLHEQGDLRKALIQLEEALRICEANDFVRLLMDEGPPLRSLLREMAAAKRQGRYRGSAAASVSFVRTVLAGMEAPGEAEGEAHPLSALFTPREMDVYEGLLDGLSGKEIAGRLGIAYETVKTHRRRIYDKLGVKNRGEAVLRAARGGERTEHRER